jgi:hypothetical protein
LQPLAQSYLREIFDRAQSSVAEPHPFYAAPAPGENFNMAPAPTLLYSKAKILKRTKFKTYVETVFFILYCAIYIAENIT